MLSLSADFAIVWFFTWKLKVNETDEIPAKYKILITFAFLLRLNSKEKF